MKREAAGREIVEHSGAGTSSAAAIITGAAAPVSTLMPACAARQIEQAWCAAVPEFSECVCSACAIPMAHIKATESTHTALVQKPRFASSFTMLLI